jgi:hypothetical protein
MSAEDILYARVVQLSEQNAQLIAALERADKLVDWMAGYIGQMAPGTYHDCFADLNQHGLFMQQLRFPAAATGGKGE